jgi:hypothetical protein
MTFQLIIVRLEKTFKTRNFTPPYIKMEEWKQSYIPKWEVSNLGNVRNKKTGYVLKPHWRKYLTVGEKSYRCAVHRLVAFAFLGDPPAEIGGDPTVDHIDNNTGNNAVSNLRWLSRSDNSRKGIAWRRAKEAAEKEKVRMERSDPPAVQLRTDCAPPSIHPRNLHSPPTKNG